MSNITSDPWEQWLLHGRFGSREDVETIKQTQLYPIRDYLLRLAGIEQGDTVLDIGCGDGLLAFGALKCVGTEGKVIFSDISPGLLAHCQTLAQQQGVQQQCQFLLASVENLQDIPDCSVNAITIRSVLIYVRDKQKAFQELHRVLQPGGRVAMFEPLNRYHQLDQFGDIAPHNQFFGYDVRGIQELADKVQAVFDHVQPPETNPMLNFDERDLLTFVRNAGFSAVSLSLHANFTPWAEHRSWKHFLTLQDNPLVPTIQDAIQQALTPQEMEMFEAHLRPLIEAGQGVSRGAWVYLQSVK